MTKKLANNSILRIKNIGANACDSPKPSLHFPLVELIHLLTQSKTNGRTIVSIDREVLHHFTIELTMD